MVQLLCWPCDMPLILYCSCSVLVTFATTMAFYFFHGLGNVEMWRLSLAKPNPCGLHHTDDLLIFLRANGVVCLHVCLLLSGDSDRYMCIHHCTSIDSLSSRANLDFSCLQPMVMDWIGIRSWFAPNYPVLEKHDGSPFIFRYMSLLICPFHWLLMKEFHRPSRCAIKGFPQCLW